MRDPNRLADMYKTMLKLHKENIPDWRLGQLLMNFLGWYYGKYHTDCFYIEDKEFIERLQVFIEESCSPY